MQRNAVKKWQNSLDRHRGKKMMSNLRMPVGVSDFREIRKNGYYYTDKTELIADILKKQEAKVTLITRPRRFGKTLGMSMLANFFDIQSDGRALFEGLKISEYPEICEKWENQYPVLFLTFKDVEGNTFSSAFDVLQVVIAQFCIQHAYLLDGELVDEHYKDVFRRLQNRTASMVEVRYSIQILTKIMEQYYGKTVILLLDEYDVPLAKASNYGYYNEMLEVLRTMMSTSLKDNSSLEFAILTGCLRISKESIFTGTNNFVLDTITTTGFNEYFGFTQADVDQLLAAAYVEQYADVIKEWYDGYHFGNMEIYCPWDVINYVRDIQQNPDMKPKSYWKNTSGNEIIRSFIDYAGASITKKLEVLLSGGSILQRLDESLTYDYLHSSEDNLWSVLYLTGYLTSAASAEKNSSIPDGMTALKIPNAEVREIFESTIIKWFSDTVQTWNRKELFDAVWTGNTEILTEEISKLLRHTISYHDYKEDIYHAFLAGIFAGAGYEVESNKEHGEGRSDIVVYDTINARVAVFEAKKAESLESMSKSCQEAVKQIADRQYSRELEEDYDEVLCFGIAFYKKRCRVGRMEKNTIMR